MSNKPTHLAYVVTDPKEGSERKPVQASRRLIGWKPGSTAI